MPCKAYYTRNGGGSAYVPEPASSEWGGGGRFFFRQTKMIYRPPYQLVIFEVFSNPGIAAKVMINAVIPAVYDSVKTHEY